MSKVVEGEIVSQNAAKPNVRRRAVRKRMLKTAAKIYAANLIINAFGTGADSVLFNNQDEIAFMIEELEIIADRIIVGIAANTLDDCLSEAIRRS